METTAPPRRRSLPPVPRPVADARPTVASVPLPGPEPAPAPADEPAPAPADEPAPGPADGSAPGPAPGRRPREQSDAGQRFVSRLRAAAPAFAAAAGADSAVVREAVPPARHRRSRCRVVLRHADGGQVDVTFLGPAAGSRGPLPAGFEEQIQQWLADGLPRDRAWLIVDRDAADGLALDLTAWSARG